MADVIYDGFSTDFDTMHEVYIQGAQLQGEYGIPVLDPVIVYPERCVSIQDAIHEKHTEKVGVRFYMHDRYQEPVWTDARRYIDVLQCFYCTFMPDLSIHSPMPKAMRIWNFYRNFVLASYFQAFGIKVVPSLFCLEMDDNQWMVNYYPKNGTVAVSTKGRIRNKTDRGKFIDGLNYYVDNLEPRNIIMVGTVPDEYQEKVETIYLSGDSEGAIRWAAAQSEAGRNSEKRPEKTLKK